MKALSMSVIRYPVPRYNDLYVYRCPNTQSEDTEDRIEESLSRLFPAGIIGRKDMFQIHGA